MSPPLSHGEDGPFFIPAQADRSVLSKHDWDPIFGDLSPERTLLIKHCLASYPSRLRLSHHLVASTVSTLETDLGLPKGSERGKTLMLVGTETCKWSWPTSIGLGL